MGVHMVWYRRRYQQILRRGEGWFAACLLACLLIWCNGTERDTIRCNVMRYLSRGS